MFELPPPQEPLPPEPARDIQALHLGATLLNRALEISKSIDRAFGHAVVLILFGEEY